MVNTMLHSNYVTQRYVRVQRAKDIVHTSGLLLLMLLSADAAVSLPGIRAKNARCNIHFSTGKNCTLKWMILIDRNKMLMPLTANWTTNQQASQPASQHHVKTERTRANKHISHVRNINPSIYIDKCHATAHQHCTILSSRLFNVLALTATNYVVLVHRAKLKTSKNLYGNWLKYAKQSARDPTHSNSSKPLHIQPREISKAFAAISCGSMIYFHLACSHYSRMLRMQIALEMHDERFCLFERREKKQRTRHENCSIDLKLTFKSLLWSVALFSSIFGWILFVSGEVVWVNNKQPMSSKCSVRFSMQMFSKPRIDLKFRYLKIRFRIVNGAISICLYKVFYQNVFRFKRYLYWTFNRPSTFFKYLYMKNARRRLLHLFCSEIHWFQ